MSANKDDFQTQLKQLKATFLDNCGQRGELIECAYAAALEATDASVRVQSLQRLHDEAHKLAGAAGSFGFQPLSEAARQVELRCKSLIASGAALGVSDTTLIHKLLLRIGDALMAPDE